MNKTKLTNVLKKMRLNAKLTCKELQEELGMNTRRLYIHNIELGKIGCTLEMLEKYAKFFKTTVWKILEEAENEERQK